MIFYDSNLQQLPNYDKIDWGPGCGNFGNQAKYSQLTIYFKYKFIGKKVCICNSNNYNLELLNSSDVDHVILNCSDHPYDIPSTTKLIKPVTILSSNFNEANFYPYHLLFSAALHNADDLTSARKYSLSCINRSPRITRIYNLMLLRRHTFYNDIRTNWFRLSESNGPIPTYTDMVAQLGKTITDEFLAIEKSYPEYNPLSEYDLCSRIDEYTDSYCNLVAESYLDNIGFVTEKIYKPIRAGQLFLVQGPPGAINLLRTQGFDVFDDYIDHSYDTELDWKTRTDLVHKSLSAVYPQIEQIFNATVERRQANVEKLKSYYR